MNRFSATELTVLYEALSLYLVGFDLTETPNPDFPDVIDVTEPDDHYDRKKVETTEFLLEDLRTEMRSRNLEIPE